LANLISKIKKGFLWAGVGSFTGRGIQFIIDIILSRILLPEDFGLIAIGLAVLNISEMLTETGFGSALIQKKGDINQHLNTAWTMELIKSFFLFIIIFMLAKPLANFYNDISIINILRGISFLFLLKGFKNVGVLYFRKNLEINKLVILETVPSIFQLFLIIPMAYYLQNAWLIIFGVYARRIAELALSYWMHPHRPKLEFHSDYFMELFNFGKWIFSISIIGAINKNFVPLFIGKYFNIETLGYFNRAELLSILLFRVLSEIIWKVGYPLMSQLQSEYNKLKKIYLDLFFILIYFCIPLTMCLILFSEELVHNIFSEKWLGSVSMLKMLLFAGFISFVGTISSIVIQSIGKPKISAKISLYSTFLLLITIIPLSNYWGMIGLIISLIIARTYSALHSSLFIIKYLDIKKNDLLSPMIFSLLNSIFFIVPIIIIKIYLFNNINLLSLIFFIVFGIVNLILLAFFWNKFFTFNIINTLSPFFIKNNE